MASLSVLPGAVEAFSITFGVDAENGGDAPFFGRTGVYAGVILQSDAIEAVEELISRQLDRAKELSPPINTAVEGDAEARAAFSLLLEPDVQRRIFLNRCKNRDFWPRIRTVVGSPPFSFLYPEDDAVLNAGGITAKRAHMAPLERAPILSSGEIADGHFADHYDRRYKVVAVDGTRDASVGATTTTFASYRSLQSGRKAVIDLKLPRMKQVARIGIHKSTRVETKGSIQFPRPGEKVKLSINEKLSAPTEASEFVIVIKSVQQRANKSPVCRVFCVVE